MGDLRGGAFGVERDSLFEVDLLLFLGHLSVKGGTDDAWGDGVDADVVGGEFAGQGAGELRECAFHHLIGEVGGEPSEAGS